MIHFARQGPLQRRLVGSVGAVAIAASAVFIGAQFFGSSHRAHVAGDAGSTLQTGAQDSRTATQSAVLLKGISLAIEHNEFPAAQRLLARYRRLNADNVDAAGPGDAAARIAAAEDTSIDMSTAAVSKQPDQLASGDPVAAVHRREVHRTRHGYRRYLPFGDIYKGS